MAGRKVRACHDCGFKPTRRQRRGGGDLEPIVVPSAPEIVHLLAKRPELRDLFPLADAVDQAVRA